MATLHEYITGEMLCEATDLQLEQSIEAALHDGGSGLILVEGVICYAME